MSNSNPKLIPEQTNFEFFVSLTHNKIASLVKWLKSRGEENVLTSLLESGKRRPSPEECNKIFLEGPVNHPRKQHKNVSKKNTHKKYSLKVPYITKEGKYYEKDKNVAQEILLDDPPNHQRNQHKNIEMCPSINILRIFVGQGSVNGANANNFKTPSQGPNF